MQQQLLLEIIPSAQPTFENTVTGDNAEAIAAVRSLVPGRALYPVSYTHLTLPTIYSV